MRETVRICLPRVMQIGGDSINEIGAVLKAVGSVKRPLIVTDKRMVEIGIADRAQHLLLAAGYSSGIFDEVLPDPTDTVVLKGIDILIAGRYDCVIGIGGGSSIDAAKAIAVMSRYSRNILDYRPPSEFFDPGLPMVAIPTTAGTGSEVTHHTVLIHESSGEKISIRGEAFVPTAAIIDYKLTMSKPKRLIADNAIDTLTHAIEAYVSKKRTLFSDRMALDTMRLVGENLERAYTNPTDEEARAALMLAATFGGIAFSNASINLVHAMSRPMGSIFNVPHGMCNAMLLTEVTKFSVDAAKDRYADCARAIGFADKSDDDEVAVSKLLVGLDKYNKVLEVPSVKSFGIDVSEYLKVAERMAAEAISSGAPNNNPRIPNKEEIIAIYKAVVCE